VVLIRGGSRSVSGPRASGIAGQIYHGLREKNYFAENAQRIQSMPAGASQ
jgi:hypothetical protein